MLNNREAYHCYFKTRLLTFATFIRSFASPTEQLEP
nr:MAG TPA: hypothetical protein [Caudoviricetes sp.]